MSVAKNSVKAALAFSVEHDVLQETIGVVIVPVSTLPRICLADLHSLLRPRLHPSKWCARLITVKRWICDGYI